MHGLMEGKYIMVKAPCLNNSSSSINLKKLEYRKFHVICLCVKSFLKIWNDSYLFQKNAYILNRKFVSHDCFLSKHAYLYESLEIEMKEYFEALHLVYFKSKTSLSQEPNKNFNFFPFLSVYSAKLSRVVRFPPQFS